MNNEIIGSINFEFVGDKATLEKLIVEISGDLNYHIQLANSVFYPPEFTREQCTDAYKKLGYLGFKISRSFNDDKQIVTTIGVPHFREGYNDPNDCTVYYELKTQWRNVHSIQVALHEVSKRFPTVECILSFNPNTCMDFQSLYMSLKNGVIEEYQHNDIHEIFLNPVIE